MSCVTCRACDVARDRSIGRESGEENRHSVGREILLKFFLLSFFSAIWLLSKMLLTGFRQLRFPKYLFFNFREGGSPAGEWREQAPFSYTCPNYQMFLGKSPAFFKILQNRLLSRTRVQSVVSYKHVCDDLSSGHSLSTA